MPCASDTSQFSSIIEGYLLLENDVQLETGFLVITDTLSFYLFIRFPGYYTNATAKSGLKNPKSWRDLNLRPLD